MSKSMSAVKGGGEKSTRNSVQVVAEPLIQHEPEERSIKVRVNILENFHNGICQQSATVVKVKAEHMDTLLGISESIQISQESQEDGIQTEVNLEVLLWCNPTKPQSLDQIVANPVLFTIIEASPKSVKAPKGDTSQILGRCNLDLLPLLLGELSIQEVLIVQPDKKLTGKQVISWPNLPRLSVTASIEEPLLTSEQIEDANILYVTLESMYNILPMMTETMNYSATTVFPFQRDELEEIRFNYGFLTNVCDVDKRKRWSGLANLAGRAAYSVYSTSDDTAKCDLNIDLDVILEENNSRVEWNALRRCWISKKAGNTICSLLNKYQCWPLEIMVSQPQQTQRSSGKVKAKDSVPQNMHFLAFPDITSLHYPGVTRARAVAQLFTFNQETLTSKFGLEKSLYESLSSTGTESTKKESSAGSKKKGENKSSSKFQAQSTPVSEPESTAVLTEQEDPVFVIMEVELFKPLVKKRTMSQLETKIMEAIPHRPEKPKSVMAAELAEKHYTQCIKIITDVISKEYQKFVQHQNNSDVKQTVEFEKDFQFHLCNSGVYQELKEMLKNKITTLIREKCDMYRNCRKEMQNYISDVYIYLVEEMHVVVNSFLDCSQPFTDPFVLSNEQLYMFAMEANEEGRFEQTNRLLLERISQDNKNPDFWLDYGIFCLQHEQLKKAKECVKETLSLNMRHKLGLLVYAILLAQNGEYNLAEVFLDALTNFYPQLTEAWLVFHLFYLKIENYPGADVTLSIARKCFAHHKDSVPVVSNESLSWSTSIYSNDSIFLVTTISLLRLHSYEFAELALAQELIHNGSSIPYLYYLAVEHYLTKRYENAISHILTAVREYGKDYCLWSLMGHCHHGLQNKVKAKECYGYIVDSYDRPKDIHLVALRFGTYCLQDKNYRQAREIFYDVCKNSPTPASWLGVGIACYMMSRLREAEQALTEANILDNKCPVIWGYLTLISLRSHRRTEFEQCYKQTRRYNLQDKQILQEIKLLQTRLKYPDPMPLPSNST